MDFTDLPTYRAYVKKRLTELTPIFARASIGDFSQSLTIPQEEDEFTELYVGIQVMLEVIQEQLANLRELNESLQDRVSALDKEVIERRKISESLRQREEELEKQAKELETVNVMVQEERARDEALLGSIGDGIIATDEQGIVSYVNHSTEVLLGWESAVITGKPWTSVAQLEDENGIPVPNDKRPIQLALTLGKSVSMHGFYHRRDGTKFPAQATVTPVLDEGRLIGSVSVIRDVTAEKEIDRMKNEFISMAAHQLRSPMSIMRWNMEILLKESETLPTIFREKLTAIYQSNQRLITLVNDLLNVSRIEQGKLFDNPQETDLSAIIAQVVREQMPAAEKNSISLSYTPLSEVPKIVLDPKRFHEVVQNIISNAIKYNAINGSVTVTLRKTAESVLLTVVDTGIGIPADDLPHIFEKFRRGRNVSQTSIEGTGLGLYVIRSLVHAWGGKIDVASTEGKGTTVTVTIPLNISSAGVQ